MYRRIKYTYTIWCDWCEASRDLTILRDLSSNIVFTYKTLRLGFGKIFMMIKQISNYYRI